MTYQEASRIIVAVAHDWMETVTDEYLEEFNLDYASETKEKVEEAIGVIFDFSTSLSN